MTSAPQLHTGVCVRVPAKVNLELRVGPPRPDGFHSLATVYQAVSLFDTIEVSADRDWGIEVVGRTAAGVPTDESNLALRAAHALADAAGIDRPVRIRVTKEIPVAGGMAGGSADAAGALLACHRLWGLDLSPAELAAIAAGLGSDIPFLLAGGTALGGGRGERVVPTATRGTYHWVFALSDEGLSTPAVYAECDRLRGAAPVPQPEPSADLLAALSFGNAEAVADAMGNDLQEAALSMQPALAGVLEAGLSFGALAGIVSGSGPTLAFLCRDAESAIDLAVSLTASGAAADVRKAHGPAAVGPVEVATCR
ncbi:4-(cytidine 5'-diphospho)-2-C-methyl-D-erythritol kinase [Nostocoides australiense]